LLSFEVRKRHTEKERKFRYYAFVKRE